MENALAIPHSFDPCCQNRQEKAHEPENEVNKALASVLLWMHHAKGNHLKETTRAESNLKGAIVYVRTLRHSISITATG